MEITSEDIELLCKFNKEKFYFDTLIDTDNILSLEDAEEKLERIEREEKEVENANISIKKRKEFGKFYKMSKNILNDKIEQFKNNKA